MSWSLVQNTGSISTNGSGVSSYGQAFGSNVTAGNLLVAGVGAFNAITGISDSRGNAWSPLVRNHGSTYAGLFWAIAKDSGACTVTVTGSTFFPGLGVAEFNPGSGKVAIYDGSGGNDFGAGGTTTPSTASITLTATDLVVGAIGSDANPTITAGTGYTSAFTSAGGAGAEATSLIYFLNDSAGTAAPAWTLSVARQCSLVGIAFKAVTATWSLIQNTGSISANGSGVTTYSQAFGSSVTAGNLLAVGAGIFDAGASATFGCTDTQSNTYTAVKSRAANGTCYGVLFTATAGSSGANTVTVTATAGGATFFPGLGVAEFNPGSGATISADGTATGTSTGAASVATSAITISSTDLILGAIGCDGNMTATPATGYFTAYRSTGGAGAEATSLIYRLDDSDATATPTWTLDATSHSVAMAGAAFKSTPSSIASAAPTAASDTSSGSAGTQSSATAAPTAASDTSTASAAFGLTATASIAAAADTFAGLGLDDAIATAAAIAAGDAAAIVGATYYATAADTESHDALAGTAGTQSSAAAAPTAGSDTSTAPAVFGSSATSAVTAASDALSGPAVFRSSASATPTAGADSASVAAFSSSVHLAGTPASDTLAGSAGFRSSATATPTAGSDSATVHAAFASAATLAQAASGDALAAEGDNEFDAYCHRASTPDTFVAFAAIPCDVIDYLRLRVIRARGHAPFNIIDPHVLSVIATADITTSAQAVQAAQDAADTPVPLDPLQEAVTFDFDTLAELE